MGCLTPKSRETVLYEAELKFKALIGIEPDNEDHKFNLAITLFNQGRFDEAKAMYLQINEVFRDKEESKQNSFSSKDIEDRLENQDNVHVIENEDIAEQKWDKMNNSKNKSINDQNVSYNKGGKQSSHNKSNSKSEVGVDDRL
jgi:tetratricopeptide (TPR) repeat protein